MPEVVFSDVIVGDAVTAPVWVYNVDPNQLVAVTVSIEGQPRTGQLEPFRLQSVPGVLRPSHVDPGVPIVVLFQPERIGDFTATLSIVSTEPPERLTIPLRAWSRADGAPLRADAIAGANALRLVAQDAWEAQRRVAEAERRVLTNTAAPYPQNKADLLDAQYEHARNQLVALGDRQKEGIEAVEKLVEKYVRRPPSAKSNHALELALFAVDVASRGLATRIASQVVRGLRGSHRVGPGSFREQYVGRTGPFFVPIPFRYYLPKPRAGPVQELPLMSDQGLAQLQEMIKVTIAGTLGKGVVGLMSKQAAADSRADTTALNFFSLQRGHLIDEKLRRGYALVELRKWLRPRLRTEPNAAIAAMRTFHERLMAEGGDASDSPAWRFQRFHSAAAWMSFLARQTAGDRSAGHGQAATDVERLAEPIADPDAPAPYDGVLDVYVRAVYHQPTAPVAIERLYMRGVPIELLEIVVRASDVDSLGELPVATRVILTEPERASFGVVVARDELGEVASSDTTGVGYAPGDGTWLARRAGHTKTSPGRQAEGARALLRTLDSLRLGDIPLGTDGN